MRVSLLGATEIEGSDSSVTRRDRIVLGALAVSGEESLSNEQLADALWGDDPPKSATKVLQGTVVRLRRLLGTDAIETTGAGYRLRLAGDAIDLRVFEDEIERARGLAAVHEPERAAIAYLHALSLWRGAPLPELQEWDPGRAEAARLTEIRRSAEEELVACRMESGRAPEAVADARHLVMREPFREHRWALLALALYRAGRQREALDALRRARRTLLDELGIDPGPELVALENRILQQDPELLAVPDLPRAATARCPYPGLRPYDADTAELFGGREDLIASYLQRVADFPLLVVVGPSGSGKSSIVRAGLVPALRDDGDAVAVMTPGASPEVTLAAALSAEPTPDVLFVDQLEELFAPLDRAEVAAFLDRLAAVVESGRRVLATLRSDHVASLSSHPAFARLAERGLVLLTPMDEEQLRRAIDVPARASGLLLEPGLVDLLVRDVVDEAGGLPLMSHALTETWARRDGNVLTVEGYTRTGGIRGAVAQTAERLYESLSPEDRATLRHVLMRLVSPGRTGEPVAVRVPTRVFDGTPDAPRLLDLLVRARLITTSSSTVTIAHESLAHAWPRLRDWLEEDQEGQRTSAHLQEAADDWDNGGRPDDELYRGARLQTAVEWRARTRPMLATREADFLDASTRRARAKELRRAAELAEQRRRNRALRFSLGGVAGLLVVSLAAGLLATANGNRAQDSANAAELSSTEADAARLATAALAETRPDVSLLLARQSVALADTPLTEGGLLGAFSLQNLLGITSTTIDSDPGVQDDSFSPDGTRVLIKAAHNSSERQNVYLVDTATGAVVTGAGLEDPDTVATYEDEPFLAGWTGGGHSVVITTESTGDLRFGRQLVTFDAVTGTPEGDPAGLVSARGGLHISPDGGTVLTVMDRRVFVWRRTKAGWSDPTTTALPAFPRSFPIQDHVGSVRFSTDGSRAAVLIQLGGPPLGRLHAVAFVVDTRTTLVKGPLVTTSDGGETSAASISPDGSWFAVGRSGGALELRSTAARGGLPVVVPGQARVTSIGWSRRSDHLVVGDGDGGLVVYSAPGLDEVARFEPTGTPVDVAALPTGAPRVVSLNRSGIITSQSLTGASAIATVTPAPGRVRAVVAGHAGTFLAVGLDDGRVDVYDQSTQRLVRTLLLGPYPEQDPALDPPYRRRVSALAVTPDGSAIIAADRIGHFRMWSATDFTVLWSSSEISAAAMAVSPDGRRLATASFLPDHRTPVPTDPATDQGSRTFDVWDLETHRRVFHDTFDLETIGGGRIPQPVAIAFSPDSTAVAVLFDIAFAVYDVATFRRRHVPIELTGGLGLAFTPDGTELIVASPGRLFAYDVRTGSSLETFSGPANGAHLAFSTDGRWLFGSDTQSLTVWDGRSHRLILPNVRMPADGTGDALSLATVSDDHLFVGTQTSLVSIDLRPARWSELACRFAGRPLSRDEWNRYLPGRAYAPACTRPEPASPGPTT